MRALSLWQPWAALWISGIKIHETRGWKRAPTYTGPLAVHAAASRIGFREVSPELAELLVAKWGPFWKNGLVFGAIIGTVDVVANVPTIASPHELIAAENAEDAICGNWSEGRWAIRAANPRRLANPVPCKATQKWFSVPDELLRETA